MANRLSVIRLRDQSYVPTVPEVLPGSQGDRGTTPSLSLAYALVQRERPSHPLLIPTVCSHRPEPDHPRSFVQGLAPGDPLAATGLHSAAVELSRLEGHTFARSIQALLEGGQDQDTCWSRHVTFELGRKDPLFYWTDPATDAMSLLAPKFWADAPGTQIRLAAAQLSRGLGGQVLGPRPSPFPGGARPGGACSSRDAWQEEGAGPIEPSTKRWRSASP